MISIREFARRKDLSESYVRKLIRRGVITSAAITVNARGWPEVNEYQANVDMAHHFGTEPPPKPVEPDPTPAPDPKPQRPPDAPKRGRPPKLVDPVLNPKEVIPSGPTSGRSKIELDKIHAELKIQLTALELKQRKGILVDKASVYKALFEIGQELRRDIMSIPDKWLDNIRAAKTRQEAYSMLHTALTDSLKTISEVDELKLTQR